MFKIFIKIMGDSKKVTKNLSDKVAEKVEERVTKVMARMSRRWKKSGGKKTGGRFRDRGATGDKIKQPINKKDEYGNRLPSHVFGSIIIGA